MIEKYLDAFPYLMFSFSDDGRFAFYLKKTGTAKRLMMLDLHKTSDLERGEVICQEDFSKRNYEPHKFHAGELYFVSDEENKENFNIYSVNTQTGKFQQVTHSTYCGIYKFQPDMQSMVFGDRYKTENGRFWTKLYWKDLQTGEERLISDDADWQYRLSWSGVCFSEDRQSLFVMVDEDNHRRKKNIARINLSTREHDLVLPKEFECPNVYPLTNICSKGDFYFVSEIAGFENIYHLDLSTGKATQLTDFHNEQTGLRGRPDNSTVHVALAKYESDETELLEIHLAGSAKPTVKSHVLPGSHQMANSNELWMVASNLDDPPTYSRYQWSGEAPEEVFKLPAYLGQKSALVHNSYRYLEYETFDGEKVPAFLSLPKGEIKGATITAFYGGTNYYSFLYQMYAELGVAVLSPAVRGSWTHGSQWREKIKGDLGGNEILDLHWGAKFLEKELGLQPERIGVQGGSHGGYAVLRALTMPQGFNGMQDSSYPYGFGICWAGFADLVDFYQTSNIPDWLVDMLGKFDEEKYRERSPVNFFNNLTSPLFISHGTNDVRVSPTSMEGFLDQLKNSDKDYQLHLMSGLGHGGGNREEDLKRYEKEVGFLQRVLEQK